MIIVESEAQWTSLLFKLQGGSGCRSGRCGSKNRLLNVENRPAQFPFAVKAVPVRVPMGPRNMYFLNWFTLAEAQELINAATTGQTEGDQAGADEAQEAEAGPAEG